MDNENNTMRFCPSCGKELQSGSQFCSNCGAKLNIQANNTTSAATASETNFKAKAGQKKKGSKTPLLIVLIVLLVLAVAAAILFGTGMIKLNKTVSSEAESTSTVEISTVKGNDTNAVVIPDLVGTDTETAKQLLISLGLVPKVTEQYGTQLKGLVEFSEPAAGNSVEKGSTVNVYSSLGYFLMYARGATGTLGATDVASTFERGSWHLDSVTCNYGMLTVEFTVNQFEEKASNYPLLFYPTIPSNRGGGYVTINENGEKATVDCKAIFTSPENVDINRLSNDVTYNQKVTITSDISNLDGSDLPRVIDILVPLGGVSVFNNEPIIDEGFAKLHINTDYWECEQEIITGYEDEEAYQDTLN
ncbi:MAG: PASTA domain-containing protein [Clostridiaceae bacterium]|nr:PASTA domain-containing protein [Clostridiaceae bacterium]